MHPSVLLSTKYSNQNVDNEGNMSLTQQESVVCPQSKASVSGSPVAERGADRVPDFWPSAKALKCWNKEMFFSKGGLNIIIEK
jgi:hypothetical protein